MSNEREIILQTDLYMPVNAELRIRVTNPDDPENMTFEVLFTNIGRIDRHATRFFRLENFITEDELRTQILEELSYEVKNG